jgi:lysozyme family protein
MSTASIIEGVIGREGRYSDNKADPGGPTMWGITEKVARAHGYMGLMRDLPRPFAVMIYTKTYVKAPGFDKVAALSPAIGEELVDTGVNMGAGLPGPWLQRILNVMNQRGTAWPDLKVDGQLGTASLAALATMLRIRGADGEKVLLRALNCLQGARYIDIAEGREASEDFEFGWFLHRVDIA